MVAESSASGPPWAWPACARADGCLPSRIRSAGRGPPGRRARTSGPPRKRSAGSSRARAGAPSRACRWRATPGASRRGGIRIAVFSRMRDPHDVLGGLRVESLLARGGDLVVGRREDGGEPALPDHARGEPDRAERPQFHGGRFYGVRSGFVIGVRLVPLGQVWLALDRRRRPGRHDPATLGRDLAVPGDRGVRGLSGRRAAVLAADRPRVPGRSRSVHGLLGDGVRPEPGGAGRRFPRSTRSPCAPTSRTSIAIGSRTGLSRGTSRRCAPSSAGPAARDTSRRARPWACRRRGCRRRCRAR